MDQVDSRNAHGVKQDAMKKLNFNGALEFSYYSSNLARVFQTDMQVLDILYEAVDSAIIRAKNYYPKKEKKRTEL